MKHVIVIETPEVISAATIGTVIGAIQLMFDNDEEITCSYWNQSGYPLVVPNATEDGLSRQTEI